MKLLIDADSCPVLDIALSIARRRQVSAILVCDTAHRIEREGAVTRTVSKGADSADFVLVNLVEKGDIVLTQDYGLAAMALSKQAAAINQNGLLYTDENIGELLFSRHLGKKIRRANGRLKGPAKRIRQNDEAFAHSFEKLLLSNIKTED